ncbi:hypothetical protein IF1G_03907 [Cordyceps javanica]|uniref:Uncharacterized protein n=1 Tax=Cordyceps javanica TaxID=43265 RepID=A0A545W3Z6_9HYPO|nr:hypothetical protein IF1G_03907 [Cordyceps javanica]TQW08666.1 hypothetical protein IF2G_03097 [Cordyceps javanica]
MGSWAGEGGNIRNGLVIGGSTRSGPGTGDQPRWRACCVWLASFNCNISKLQARHVAYRCRKQAALVPGQARNRGPASRVRLRTGDGEGQHPRLAELSKCRGEWGPERASNVWHALMRVEQVPVSRDDRKASLRRMHVSAVRQVMSRCARRQQQAARLCVYRGREAPT